MAEDRNYTEQHWQVVLWRNQTNVCHGGVSHEDAIKVSYQAFVSGESYPEAIVSPDRVKVRSDDTIEEAHGHENLSTVWDQWLQQHPDERADWDTSMRQPRLRILKQKHVPGVLPFSSEDVVANPDWYREIYRPFGMTDEIMATFLQAHRFALAEKEAQRAAKEREGDAPLQHQRTAAIYLERYSDATAHQNVPLATQERACRAYCKRVGYQVHRVFRATTPPPTDVPVKEEIGIGPEHAFFYYQRDSRHPFHVAINLLEERKIDVIVEFVETGPSRGQLGDSPPNESSNLSSLELASLWEIEPPTEDERQSYELLKRIGRAETEEEQDVLVNQLLALSKRVKKPESGASIPAATVPLPNVYMRAVKPKVCYTCNIRPARAGSAFCSDTCAQAAAERFVQTTTQGWCSACGTWIGSEGCPHFK